ncbi:hypothetical protein JTE90_024867 [Oedothorax gibbosus]|uniref:Uncharacterized protein n=1 Tax=Oedothorax gibbosus TaxID=931172 RepID=A0AAV6V4B9_9ARAC|nr:hypothetical protein JTE90_024867 [Oedothorax gibbosus]
MRYRILWVKESRISACLPIGSCPWIATKWCFSYRVWHGRCFTCPRIAKVSACLLLEVADGSQRSGVSRIGFSIEDVPLVLEQWPVFAYR